MANSCGRVFRPPKCLRGFTNFYILQPGLTLPPKLGIAQLLMPIAVTHPLRDLAEGCYTSYTTSAYKVLAFRVRYIHDYRQITASEKNFFSESEKSLLLIVVIQKM